MATYLITYDLNKETSRPKIVEEIRKTTWAKLSESSYAIATTETVELVYARFKKHLDSNDHFYVISLRRPYTGWGPKDVNDWLEQYLPR